MSEAEHIDWLEVPILFNDVLAVDTFKDQNTLPGLITVSSALICIPVGLLLNTIVESTGSKLVIRNNLE